MRKHLPATDIAEIVYRLLGCSHEGDGIAEDTILKAEKALKHPIPPALRTLYRLAGNNKMLMDSFNHFAAPEQLEIHNGRVLFLEENQSACYWGYAPGNDNPMVSMHLPVSGEWLPETLMNEFLPILLYYQCAQGGYEHCGSVLLDKEKLAELVAKEWDRVVEYNGLFIAWKPDCLIWHLDRDEDERPVESAFFSARTENIYAAHEVRYIMEYRPALAIIGRKT